MGSDGLDHWAGLEKVSVRLIVRRLSLTLAKELLRESLRKMPVPRSNVLSLAGMAPCGCAKRPAVALLARRAWAWTGGSPSSTSGA